MSILHRIFINKYKHKKIVVGRKKVYKKFLGLKTLKPVLYTKLSTAYGQPKPVKKIVKPVLPRKLVPKYIKLKFPSFLTLLPSQARRQEELAAQADIANFKNLKIEGSTTEPKEKFQAFLPRIVWNKMTSDERRSHINKRRALAIKKQNNSAPAAKYTFSNRSSRPILNKMNFTQRRCYLKNLIKFASMEIPEISVAPFGTKSINELSIENVKFKIQSSKKSRAKRGLYKNLTYRSIVPSSITKFIF